MEIGCTSGVAVPLLHFFNNKQNVNVKLTVQWGETHEEFLAHKLVLKLWSPVFEDLLANRNEITIINVCPSIFGSLLKFLYGSKEAIMNNEDNVQFLLGLYKAAETYEVIELKNVCFRILIQSPIDIKNVFDLLEAAEYIKIKNLKSKCIEVLESKTNEILSAHEIKNVTCFMIKSVLNLSKLNLSSEYQLLSWLFEWAEMEFQKYCQEKASQNTHLRIIHPFLPYLNFASLKGEEFANLVDNHRGFFNDKDCFAIFMNILCPNTRTQLPYWHTAEGLREFTLQESTEGINSLTTDQENLPLENHVTSNNNSEDAVSGQTSHALESDDEEFIEEKVLVTQQQNTEKPDDSRVSLEKPDKSKVNVVESEGNSRSSYSSVTNSTHNGFSVDSDSECSFDLLNDPVKDRKKIKKKKLKTCYLISDGRKDVFRSCDSWSSQYSSSQFDSIVAEIWKQQKYSIPVAV